MVLAIAIIISFISYYSYDTQKENYKKLLLDGNSEKINQKTILIKQFINEKKVEVKLLSNMPELDLFVESHDKTFNSESEKIITASFLRVMESNPDISYVQLLRLDGHELLRFNSINGKVVEVDHTLHQDKSNTFDFVNTLKTDSVNVSNIQLNEEHGEIQQPLKKILRVSSPVKNSFGETVSILLVTYDALDILDALFKSTIGKTMVFDNDGNFLLHPNEEKEFAEQLGTTPTYFLEEPELEKNMYLLDSKQHADPQSREFRIWEKVYYDEQDPSKFWIIMSVIPYGVLYSYMASVQNELLLLIGFLTMASIFASIIISRQTTRPILSLLTGMKKVEKGDLNVSLKNECDNEIGQTFSSFNSMVQSLRQSKILVDEYEHEIEQTLIKQNTLQNALNQTVMVSETDKHGNIIYVNKKFCDVTKYSKNELLGKNHRIIKSDHPDSVYKNQWDTITQGKTWSGEIKNKTKYGTYFWVQQAITPQLDHNGNIVEYVSLMIDITKRKNAEHKLIDAMERLQEIDKSKNEFSAMMSHELRTPLTPIQTYCDVLKESKSSNLSELERECIEEIESNSQKLNTLISDMLDSQKLDLDKLKFHYNKFDVSVLIDSLIRDLGPTANQKNISLKKGFVKSTFISSDELRIFQVLTNLVKNSLDFVLPNSGVIEIGANIENEHMRFYVKDNGMGIKADKIPYIFKKFYQIDSSINRQHGGTGLGLVICKGIVNGLGGKIWVESELGKETSFFFTIPLKKQSIQEVVNVPTR